LHTFNELRLEQKIVQAIKEMGFKELTPIQRKAIPYALEGKDLVGQAQTGTGKTAAYGIPLIQRIEVKKNKIKGLVLTPTRELALQVAEELNKIGKHKGIKSVPIYGGQNIMVQIKKLKKKAHIITATPGRLLDHINRGTIKLDSIDMVVIDEADEMLNMGFIEDVESILEEIPKERQTLLFSATMPKAVRLLANRFMKSPKTFSVMPEQVSVSTIKQQCIKVSEKYKLETLCHLIDTQSPKLAIVFGKTKRRVDEINKQLNERGYKAGRLHGDLNQRKRDSVLNRFRKGLIEILVATDVAARGLDIEGITHVYNFDIPQDGRNYVHRIGRTGRGGKKGTAITFVSPREIGKLKKIEGVVKRKLKHKTVQIPAKNMNNQQKIIV
jgi:ATP-dependent RNA helicase DeaD